MTVSTVKRDGPGLVVVGQVPGPDVDGVRPVGSPLKAWFTVPDDDGGPSAAVDTVLAALQSGAAVGAGPYHALRVGGHIGVVAGRGGDRRASGVSGPP